MIRLGVVSYLNALPLWKPLAQRDDIEIVRDVPSRLQSLLDADEVDAALLPIVDYFRHGGHLVSDACIGADGAVRSVLLLSQKPLREIASVAIDISSHSSVALTRVSLQDAVGIAPSFFDYAPDLAAMWREHDAALLIGDAALEAVNNGLPENVVVWDLGAAWHDLTGLPFVFAAWIARENLSQNQRDELSVLLSQTRDEGETCIAEYAREAAHPTLPVALIESYLRHAIGYYITPRHRAGIDEFRARCAKFDLI